MLQAPATRRRGSRDLSRNHKRLYGLIRQQPSLSRAELVRACGLTFPSVSRLVDDLIQYGLVAEGTTRRGGIGKPPVELSINPNSAYSLGVHLEGSRATAALINASGEIMNEASF